MAVGTQPCPPPVRVHGTSFRSTDDDWYSEYESDLLDVWHSIEDMIRAKGIVMLDKCRFNQFCAFVVSATTTCKKRCI